MTRTLDRLLLTMAGVLFVVSAVAAQPMRLSPEERARALKDSLSLDTAQTAKVTGIYRDAQAAMQEAFQNAAGDRESMRATMQDITRRADERIKELLNDTQKKRFEEMIKNRPQRGMHPRRN